MAAHNIARPFTRGIRPGRSRRTAFRQDPFHFRMKQPSVGDDTTRLAHPSFPHPKVMARSRRSRVIVRAVSGVGRARLDSAMAVVATVLTLLVVATTPSSQWLHSSLRGAESHLHPRTTLTVDVRHADGTVVSNADVRVFTLSDGRYYPSGSAKTTAKGRSRSTSKDPGSAWILVEASMLARKSTPISLEGTPRTVDVTLSAAATLRVASRPTHTNRSSTPPCSSPVRIRSLTAPSPPRAERWSSAGSRRPLGTFASPLGATTKVRSGVASDLTIALRKSSAVLVSVVDAKGAPVPDATILVVGSTLWPARQIATDANGERSSRGSTGAYDLKAQKGSLVSR